MGDGDGAPPRDASSHQRDTGPLFVTRKFPPSIGGMQTLAAGVWRALLSRARAPRLIAHGGSNRLLPLWLLTAVPRAAWTVARGRADSVLTGDALMYAVMRPFIARVPHATMVMGLDVTYPNPAYRALVHRALRRAPRVIAISRATAEATEAIGVRAERISVVRLGIAPPAVEPDGRQLAADAIRVRFAVPHDQVAILTLGRLVRRKGIAWFLRHVFSQLPKAATYLIAGEGPMVPEIESTIRDLSIEDRVRVIGPVDDEDRERLLRGADIFVQPNVRVPGDMEGFGLVVLEAAMRGTPTVASGLEGILDAVVDGETGILLPPGDAPAWIDVLTRLISEPHDLTSLGERFQRSAQRLYSEEQMGDELLALLTSRAASTRATSS